ncbi:oligosaccharide flippase family protein [Edwardsiella ictaluri]|uniref:oligosaccharide flippase family protein n=1 Tax=Edwardsiella ictaluri TaxID=67780 RepID=UPI00259CBB71|nr:oligosaccharide flippase family protein [Edwardsiella ictaluri]WJH20678.1 O12 family O-antigen flippase [Edwardsiella ictaluri]
MSSLLKNSISLLAMQGINYILPLVTLPYLTRILHVYPFGIYSATMSVGAYVILFINFGFDLSATRKIAKSKGDNYAISAIFFNVILAKFLLFFLSFVIVFLLLYTIDSFGPIRPLFFLLIPQFIGCVFFPVWLYQGVERLYLISAITSATKLLIIPLFFLFVRDVGDIDKAIIISGFPLFFSGIIGFYLAYKLNIINFSGVRVRVNDAILLIKESTSVFIGTVAISIYTACTPIILSIVSNYTEVGYFSAVDKLRSAILGMFIVLGQVFYPRATVLFESDFSKYKIFIRRIIFSQIIFGGIGMILFYFFMPIIAPFILGHGFHGLTELIEIMAPMILLIPLSVIFSNCILLPMGKSKLFYIVPIMTAIIHLPYSIYLSEKYGAFGGGVSILITEVLSLMLLCFFLINTQI